MNNYPQVKRSRYTQDIVIFTKPNYGYLVTYYYNYEKDRPISEKRWNTAVFKPITECTVSEYNKIAECIIKNKLSGVSTCIK